MLLKPANMGYAKAQLRVGLKILRKHQITKQIWFEELDNSLECLRKAAAQDYLEAQAALAMC